MTTETNPTPTPPCAAEVDAAAKRLRDMHDRLSENQVQGDYVVAFAMVCHELLPLLLSARDADQRRIKELKLRVELYQGLVADIVVHLGEQDDIETMKAIESRLTGIIEKMSAFKESTNDN